MALSATTQILIAFCQQELLGNITELAQFLIDLRDPDCPVQFISTTVTDKLELQAEKLALEEPDQYVNYDAWLEWEEKTIELENQIEAETKKAAARITGINEWWLCTKRLGEELEKHGQIVVFHENLAFWGRECFGYDPVYDKVIKDIATELEILPDMSHDWSKHIKIEK